jgi:integrase
VPRRRETGGVRKRGAVWWIYYRVDGRQIDESAETGDERVARSLLAQRRRELRDGTWKPPTERAAAARVEEARRALEAALAAAPEAAPLTVRAYLESWIARRQRTGVVKAHDEERLFAVHVYPVIGTMPLVDVKRAHIREVVERATTHVSEATGRVLAPRTVLHVYRTLATAFADARDDELIASTPCTLRTRKGELPAKRDRDPAWRAEAVFTRDELEQLISDERIPLDRRVYYALLGLGGLRSSEAASVPWRAYDAAARPLGRLVVATQAEDGETAGETKTGEVRDVPVVPALASLLAEWRGSGFAMLLGWRPRPDDPIVPSRASSRDRVLFRSKKMLERLGEDLAAIKLRAVPSPRHALRATFLSLLEVDGANMAIARRATHAAPTDVVGGYIRVRWDDVCREVGKLRVELRRGAKVIAIARARNDFAPTDSGADSEGAIAAFALEQLRGGRDSNGSAPKESKGKTRAGADSRALGGPENPARGTREVHALTHVSPSDVAHELASLSPDELARLIDAIRRR